MKKIGSVFTLILIILLKIIAIELYAQEYQLISKASKYRVNKYEEFEISFTLNGQGTNFSEPKNLRENFTVISGPNSRVFSSFDHTGFKIEQTISYIVLAKKVGKFIISEATVNVGGKTIKSKPIEIEVTSVSADEITDPNDPKYIAKKLAFVKVKLPKNNLYVGEGMIVEYLLYYKTSVSNIEILNEPVFNGFYTEIIKQESETFQEQVNGEYYNVVPLKKYLILGQKAGRFDLGALEVRIPTEVPTNRRDLFNPFLGSSYVVNQISVFKVPVITVKPLPPSSSFRTPFSGAVGNMKIKASLSKSDVQVGEAVSLRISLEGSGNLKMVSLPELNFSEQFDVYEPKISENYSITSRGFAGTKTLEYILVPKFNGRYKLPKISFLYFNISKNTYEEIVIDNLEIRATGGTVYEDARYISKNDKQREASNAINMKDILFIKQNFNQRNILFDVSSSFVLFVWTGITIAFFLLILIYHFFLEKYIVSIQKNKEIRTQLKDLLRYIDKSNDSTREKLNYIYKNFKNIVYSNVTKSNTHNTSIDNLVKHSIFAENSMELMQLFKDSEKAIYAGMSDDQISEILARYKQIFAKYL